MTGVQTCALPICFPVTIGQFICFTENPKDNEKPAGQKEQQREKPKPKEKGKVTIIEPETIETTDDDGAEPDTIESGNNTRTDVIEPGIIEQIEPEQQPEPGKHGRGKGGRGKS